VLGKCGLFFPFQITYVVAISRNTMHALSGSMHSVHPILTPSSFRSLAPAATMLLSLKSCHWPPSYQVVTSHQDLGQRTILQGGPVQMSLRSASLLLSISTFLCSCFTSLKTESSTTFKLSCIFFMNKPWTNSGCEPASA